MQSSKWLLFRLGELASCVEDCSAALELHPTYSKALHRSAWECLKYENNFKYPEETMGVLWQHNSCDVLVTYPIRGYYPRRAVCHGELNEHGSAVRDWEALCSLEPHNGDQAFGGSQNFWKYPRIGDYKEGLRKAKRAKADEDRKDYYSLLQVDISWMCLFSSSCTTGKLWFCHQDKNPTFQVDKSATLEEIKKAYRKEAVGEQFCEISENV